VSSFDTPEKFHVYCILNAAWIWTASYHRLCEYGITDEIEESLDDAERYLNKIRRT
jgi:hypothetical protein